MQSTLVRTPSTVLSKGYQQLQLHCITFGLHDDCFSNLRLWSPTLMALPLSFFFFSEFSVNEMKNVLHFPFYPNGALVILLPVPSYLPTTFSSNQSLLQNTFNTSPKKGKFTKQCCFNFLLS